MNDRQRCIQTRAARALLQRPISPGVRAGASSIMVSLPSQAGARLFGRRRSLSPIRPRSATTSLPAVAPETIRRASEAGHHWSNDRICSGALIAPAICLRPLERIAWPL